MAEEERPRINGVTLLALVLLVAMVLIVLTGGGVVSTKSGCQDRVKTDPEYAPGANWYGIGLGFCIAE